MGIKEEVLNPRDSNKRVKPIGGGGLNRWEFIKRVKLMGFEGGWTSGRHLKGLNQWELGRGG